jgi:hypothetical protein
MTDVRTKCHVITSIDSLVIPKKPEAEEIPSRPDYTEVFA